MCKRARRTPGTAEREASVAHLLASEACHTRLSVPDRSRAVRVQRPLSMPFPGRTIERVLRDFATPSNKDVKKAL